MFAFHRIAAATAAAALLLLSGCASPTSRVLHLNDAARGTPGPDITSGSSEPTILYETQTKAGISVSYNLVYDGDDYRLTLIMRNNTSTPRVLSPVITMRDPGGFLVQPYSYQGFVAEAAQLANTPVPEISPQLQSSYYSSGTIRNTATGATYSYTETTTADSGGFAGGLAAGLAQGMAIRAARERENQRTTGLAMFRWARAYWLKSSYELPAESAVSGALILQGTKQKRTPLRLTIVVGGQTYEFVTDSQGRESAG
jgi:hypothetical protein